MSITLPARLAAPVAAALLAACSPGTPSAPPAPTAPVNTPQQASDLQLYQTLVARKQYELAAPIGAGVIERSPASPAAAEIRKTLADTQAKAKVINDERRLAGLWLYQTGEQSGGTQHTATIYPSTPAWANGRIRLILRRHSDWGQSVYFYDTGDAGFVCKSHCKLALKVDGKDARALDGYLPETGEPAMFIDHDPAFVKLMESAKTLDITVHPKGRDAAPLHFEVAGFDAAQWPAFKTGGKHRKAR